MFMISASIAGVDFEHEPNVCGRVKSKRVANDANIAAFSHKKFKKASQTKDGRGCSGKNTSRRSRSVEWRMLGTGATI